MVHYWAMFFGVFGGGIIGFVFGWVICFGKNSRWRYSLEIKLKSRERDVDMLSRENKELKEALQKEQGQPVKKD